MYQTRIQSLRNLMKQKQIDYYLIFMNDDHGSEYIPDYYKAIAYFCGFTGSAGTLLITQKDAYFWTDGRYFLQAEEQLENSQAILMKMGMKNVPKIKEFLAGEIKTEKKKSVVAFDGRLVSNRFALELIKECKKENISELLTLSYDQDLVSEIWNKDTRNQRKVLNAKSPYLLSKEQHGMETKEKLSILRKSMEGKADYLLVSALDEVAWITNLRGDDIAYNPVFYSFMLIGKQTTDLYLMAADEKVKAYLEQEGITWHEYEALTADLQGLKPGQRIWLDEETVSVYLAGILGKEHTLIFEESPVLLPKAVKNAQEIENERKAHIYDGVAVTKFIYWLKTRVAKGNIATTEMDAAKYLETLRQEMPGYLYQSFAPIIAYKEHGAIVHYEAKEDTNVSLESKGFVLCDTGGHYEFGTTDITRTVALGALSAEEKTSYTAVLMGNLRLMDAVFIKGSKGYHLDQLAREPLYKLGLDYRHGTGHGVGYLLNVHEGPNAFRKSESGCAFAPGMITSDEPGVYIDGKYGIRLENLIVCVEKEENSYGQFLGFEPLTLVPFDRDAILWDMLTSRDKELLHAYHAKVRKEILPYLSQEEKEWLIKETEDEDR